MRHAPALVLIGLLAAVFPLDRAQACGDKLLLFGRDFPFSRGYAAVHPASILIYLPKSANTHGAGNGLASLLRRAGHTAEVTGDVPHLTQSLQAGQVDIVLANLIDMPDAERASVTCPTPPVFLPYLFDASDAALSAAQQRYPFALKVPDTASRFLGTIDHAMGSRPSHAKRKH